MLFTSPDQAKEWIADWRNTSRPARESWARRAHRATAYYLGHQFVRTRQFDRTLFVDGKSGKRLNNIERQDLRTQINRTTLNTLRAAAATRPRRIHVATEALGGDTSLEAQAIADMIEVIANAGVKQSGMLQAAKEANFKRCLHGDAVIGLDVNYKGTREVGGETVPELSCRCFVARYDQLTLDPAMSSPNLNDHEWVMFSEAMTARKIERVYGVKLEDEQTTKLGQLRSHESIYSGITGGDMFNQYAAYSTTPGAVVHFIHVAARPGRWPTMQVFVETADGLMLPAGNTIKNPATPFGDDALPYAVLRGHMSGDGPRSIGDATMQLDDQDRLNVYATILMQNLRQFTGAKTLIDKRWFGNSADDNDIKQKFTTSPYGQIIGKPVDNRASPPQYLNPPPLPVYMENMVAGAANDMRDQAFRGPHHEGMTKSHVTADAANRTMDETNQVLDQRGEDDVEQYTHLLRAIAGTTIKQSQARSPGTLAALADEGFDEFKFEMLSSVDARRLPVVLKVQGQTVRYRSKAQREQALQFMLVNQQITGEEYRKIVADELDSPLSEDDHAIGRLVRDNALQVAGGTPWEAVPMGVRYGTRQIEAFQRLMLDKKVRQDEGAMERLAQASASQRAVEQQAFQAEQPADPNGSQVGQGEADPASALLDIANLVPPPPGAAALA